MIRGGHKENRNINKGGTGEMKMGGQEGDRKMTRGKTTGMKRGGTREMLRGRKMIKGTIGEIKKRGDEIEDKRETEI